MEKGAASHAAPRRLGFSNSAVSAVVFGVHFRGVAVVFGRMQGMAVGDMRMMCGLFVISCLVMLGGFAMMFSRVLMMLRGLLMVLVDLVLAVHDCLPVCGFILDAKHRQHR
jgi:hypothetical protein